MVQKDKNKDRNRNTYDQFKSKKSKSKFIKPFKMEKETKEEWSLTIPSMREWAGYDEY